MHAIGDPELRCHRKRKIEAVTFWNGFRVPVIQSGLRSTASPLTDLDEFFSPDDDIAEFTNRYILE